MPPRGRKPETGRKTTGGSQATQRSERGRRSEQQHPAKPCTRGSPIRSWSSRQTAPEPSGCSPARPAARSCRANGALRSQSSLRARAVARGSLGVRARSACVCTGVVISATERVFGPDFGRAPVAAGAHALEPGTAGRGDTRGGSSEGQPAIAKILADAHTYRELGLGERAIEVLRRALTQFPDSIEVRELLRDTLAETGNTDGAIEEMLEIAQVYLAHEQEDHAETVLRNILEAVPNHKKANALLGQLGRLSALPPAGSVPVGLWVPEAPPVVPSNPRAQASAPTASAPSSRQSVLPPAQPAASVPLPSRHDAAAPVDVGLAATVRKLRATKPRSNLGTGREFRSARGFRARRIRAVGRTQPFTRSPALDGGFGRNPRSISRRLAPPAEFSHQPAFGDIWSFGGRVSTKPVLDQSRFTLGTQFTKWRCAPNPVV